MLCLITKPPPLMGSKPRNKVSALPKISTSLPSAFNTPANSTPIGRDNYIKGITDWYDGYLEKLGIDYIHGFGKLVNKNTVSVNGASMIKHFLPYSLACSTAERPPEPAPMALQPAP
jgi:hypothetical protein